MQGMKQKVGESLILVKKNGWCCMLKPSKGSSSSVVLSSEKSLSDVGFISFSSTATGKNAVDLGIVESVKKVVLKSGHVSKTSVDPSRLSKDVLGTGNPISSRGWWNRECPVSSWTPYQLAKYRGQPEVLPCLARSLASSSASQSSRQTRKENRKDISTVDDPFDAPTYNIPEKPVSFAEGASYSVIILAGLGIAAAAGYAVFKELIFEPKEYKIFGKALERVQNDSQVRVRIGSPVTGYGQESRNRAARQRIPNRTWTDEDGIEHVEVNFYIRGPHGAGKVYTEMFKDKADKQWKFTYLIVEIKSPSPAQLMLESYVPA
ncbi:probable mitochondrial import inner membrane translocase subunit TIM21 isoform X2 [Macadamia integrifolia]|uniref:probable mitochondrial import inner membrane translocase subunit TIM21 isoform X2 n=1 Tax=Macadamia integrifolia TaxID=60698 RepID=UPI001C4FB9C3|nr:probable mitochondrial import inner membrane translocase subunit TIM21 isoform X2 [Macadamia integrifolia]